LSAAECPLLEQQRKSFAAAMMATDDVAHGRSVPKTTARRRHTAYQLAAAARFEN
jgi:hypothetical protein